MYVKVSVGDNEPIIYQLTKDVIIVGSDHTAVDLYIPETSVSKKHLKIIKEGTSTWQVVDVGSLNGTHVDEKRLVPGKRIDVADKLTLLLGHKTEMTFLTESKLPFKQLAFSHTFFKPEKKPTDGDKTQLISLDEFKAAQSEAAKKKKKELIEKKHEEARIKKADTKRFNRMLIFGGLVIVIGFFGNKYWVAHQRKMRPKTIIKKMEGKAADLEIEASLEGRRIPQGDRLTRAVLLSLVEKRKCIDEVEEQFCRGDFFREKHSGVLLHESGLLLFVHSNRWLQKAQALTKARRSVTGRSRSKVIVLNFVKEYFVEPLADDLKVYNYFIIFYSADFEGGPIAIDDVMAFKGRELHNITEKFDPFEVMDTSRPLDSLIDPFDPYYNLY